MHKTFHPDLHKNGTTISPEEINLLPLKSFSGEIILVNDTTGLKQIFKEIHTHDIVGFDTETRPSFSKGERHSVALMQLALPEKVFLIRLKQTGITEEIVHFLEHRKVTKAGIGLRDDLLALQQLKRFSPSNFVDLATEAREAGLKVESVKKLTALLLGFRISKSAQTSNWDAPVLTPKQLDYAAMDAWVCREIYLKIKQV